MNKRLLQIILYALGAVPLLTGALYIIFGSRFLTLLNAAVSRDAVTDSQIRFFGAVWLGLGVILYWIIPSIDRQTTLFRLVAGAIFLGGIGRLLSVLFVGTPHPLFIGLITIEIIVVPILVLWQHRLAKVQSSQQ